MDAGFDPALSLHMGVDHGVTQAYAALDAQLRTPIAPIMVNCAGEPLPSLRRCYEFGRAIGRAIRATPGSGRALVVGSGGLSHSPPSVSPDTPGLAAETRDYVVNGRGQARAFNAAREQASIERRKLGGVGPINEAWDAWFLKRIELGDLEPILALSAADLLAQAGVGGQEVRAWMAALGAWDAPVADLAYEPVPTWITGMGCISAFRPVA
jgi:2,3-dihydroxyphenylpropionate 1,2-dioxygenase